MPERGGLTPDLWPGQQRRSGHGDKRAAHSTDQEPLPRTSEKGKAGKRPAQSPPVALALGGVLTLFFMKNGP